MLRRLLPSLFLLGGLRAEVHNLSLQQTVDRALEQAPEVILARLDEQRAQLDVRIARDPFHTRLYVGSGLAYTNGFPMSIEGSAPSVVQARAVQSFYNRPRQLEVAAARETARSVALDTATRRDEVAFRAASLYSDAAQARRSETLLKQQLESLERVLRTVESRVAEGRELPIENRRATVNLARVRQQVEVIQANRSYLETSLAAVLGYPASDQVSPVDETPAAWPMPKSAEEAVDNALRDSHELKKLQSQLLARGLAVQAGKAARLPVVDLVAQYGLFARFNHYEDFFRRFQRNNGQIGVSFQLPLLPGSAAEAQAAQAQLDVSRLRTQINSARARIEVDTRKGYQDLQTAESARDVARQDLELSREDLGVALARLEEGRVSLRDVEGLRAVENQKFLAFYEAQHTVEKTELALLRLTGTLLAAIRQTP